MSLQEREFSRHHHRPCRHECEEVSQRNAADRAGKRVWRQFHDLENGCAEGCRKSTSPWSASASRGAVRGLRRLLHGNHRNLQDRPHGSAQILRRCAAQAVALRSCSGDKASKEAPGTRDARSGSRWPEPPGSEPRAWSGYGPSESFRRGRSSGEDRRDSTGRSWHQLRKPRVSRRLPRPSISSLNILSFCVRSLILFTA